MQSRYSLKDFVVKTRPATMTELAELLTLSEEEAKAFERGSQVEEWSWRRAALVAGGGLLAFLAVSQVIPEGHQAQYLKVRLEKVLPIVGHAIRSLPWLKASARSVRLKNLVVNPQNVLDAFAEAAKSGAAPASGAVSAVAKLLANIGSIRQVLPEHAAILLWVLWRYKGSPKISHESLYATYALECAEMVVDGPLSDKQFSLIVHAMKKAKLICLSKAGWEIVGRVVVEFPDGQDLSRPPGA